MNHRKISAKGGKAGRGAAKARTSEQARAAAQAGWAKRRKEMFERSDWLKPDGSFYKWRKFDGLRYNR